ncbi:MAG: hypothetical protein AB7U20_20430, partial [Planctomycetaceae bacterium]
LENSLERAGKYVFWEFLSRRVLPVILGPLLRTPIFQRAGKFTVALRAAQIPRMLSHVTSLTWRIEQWRRI